MFKLKVFLDTSEYKIIKNREKDLYYAKEIAKQIGKEGFFITKSTDGDIIFYPPNRIVSIEISKEI